MNNIQMTEMQKAYFVGRGDSSIGLSGTHLYIEILYKGEPEALERALNKVIKAQPFMRAKINSQMTFTIKEKLEYKVCVTQADPNDSKLIKEIREKLSHKIYTQDDFPLFTIQMLGRDSHYRIFLSIDMLIADGLSLYEICREIKENIANPDKEEESRLEDLIYMTDYYQEQRLSKRYFRSRDYYMKKLDDILPPPSLGYVSTQSDGKFAHLFEIISSDDFKKICDKVVDLEITVTDVLLTTYAFVLARWSRYSNMSINTTSFLRPKGEKYRTVVGDFTTSMLVQVKIDWNKSFLENAKEIKKSLFVSYKNSMFEVPELIREVARKNHGVTMPVVFTSMLFDGIDLWDENFVCDYTISQTSQVNLDNQVKKMGDKLNVTWDYRRDLFDSENIEKMFTEYLNLIRMFANSQEDLVEKFKEVSSKDTCKTYGEYNRVAAGVPRILGDSLKNKFIQTVEKFGSKTFVYIEGESYTFDWVYDRAKLLADKISEKMQKKDRNKTRVAFMGAKNIDSFVNIVAAVLSDNSFCVINEDYGQEKKKETLDQLKNYILIENDELFASDDNSTIGDDESYILFTSGTTGKPKGIVIDEKAALNTVLTINKMFDVSSKDKILNISNLYFDLSIYDIFAAMILGAEIISVNPMLWGQLDAGKANKITVWNSTPALANEYAAQKKLDSIRVFLMSGDFVPVSLVDTLFDIYSDKVKVNSLGGATEASIWSNYFDCSKPHNKNAIPYGHPLYAQELYVINSDSGFLCPQGVLGEICISGEGLAVGYLDAEQTEHAFVYNKELSKRVYKTGDLGYLGNDGAIYIVGRIVQEIKHNGYRIDLREIEKYINSIENVSNALVIIERQNDMRTKLSAVVESNDREIDATIRKHLAESLPYYMIPSNILVVKKFPLTSNGKVDTKEIRKWLTDSEATSEEFTGKQKKLLETWKTTIPQQLYIEITHQDATYFDAGGQSLQAVELRNIIANEYEIEVSLQEIMSNISLRSMSELIGVKKAETKQSKDNKVINELGELILIRKGTGNKNLVLIHGGTGEVTLFIGMASHFDEEYNIYGIRRNKKQQKLAPQIYDFNQLGKAYVELLEKFDKVDVLGGWCVGGLIAYEMSLARPNKFKKLLMINAESPIIDAPAFLGFSVKADLKLLEEFTGIKLNEELFEDVEALWEFILKVFEQNDKLRLKMIHSLPQALTRILPSLDNLDAKTTIHQINHWRGAYEARNHYSRNDKSRANVIYLNAIDDPMDNYLSWSNYFESFEDMDIGGNHVSLFEEENVSIWCKELNEKIKNWN
ncbi:MAG: AMP-binding protein [Lachnospiraceae bacterium]|nr:AMP-binding protein [Lachnospiraceae bacterium]